VFHFFQKLYRGSVSSLVCGHILQCVVVEASLSDVVGYVVIFAHCYYTFVILKKILYLFAEDHKD